MNFIHSFINRRKQESETSIDKTFLSFINFKMSFDVMFKFQFQFEFELKNSNREKQKHLKIRNKNSFLYMKSQLYLK